jgi:hypothetical protein
VRSVACENAARGAVSAMPPRSVMNSRRLILALGSKTAAYHIVAGTGCYAVRQNARLRSVQGHSRHFERAQATSASHPIADILLRRTDRREGPGGDIAICGILRLRVKDCDSLPRLVEYLAAVWPVSREQILHSPLEVTMDRRETLVGLAFVCATVGAVGITKMAEAEDGKKVPEVA